MKSFLLIGQSNMAGRGDGIYFNSASYRIFGMRYFKKYSETSAL